MEKPQSINPVEWAEYNSGVGAHAIRALPVMLPRIGVDLILEPAIRRAVNDLEGQGERSDRIALQLLTALAQYAKETGR